VEVLRRNWQELLNENILYRFLLAGKYSVMERGKYGN
jgi:hypothetical protein